MTAREADQEFVEYVVGKLVTKPEAVVTKRTIDELGVLIELTVDRDDMGVIIGKEGKTAKAIRTLLRVLGAKNDSRINLKIVEPEGGEPRPPREESHEEVAAEVIEPEKKSVFEEDEDESPMADLDL